MSAPAPDTDSKKAPLLAPEEQTTADTPAASAPPSYTAATSSGTVRGDGGIFSDMPRATGPTMAYGLGRREHYVSRSERKTWGFGFFDCFRDPGASAKACCCPCVSYGQTRHRLHFPNSESTAPVCSTPCLGYCLTAGFIPGAESIFGLLQRGEIRSRLDLDMPTPKDRGVHLGSRQQQQARIFEGLEQAGGFLDDAWRHFFCACCALVQEEREVRAWEAQMQEGSLEGLEEGIRAEGERLLGGERRELTGLRG